MLLGHAVREDLRWELRDDGRLLVDGDPRSLGRGAAVSLALGRRWRTFRSVGADSESTIPTQAYLETGGNDYNNVTIYE